MTATAAATTAFHTTLAGEGGRTGIVVPDDAVAQLGAGHRPPVHVDLDGYGYRSTVAVMGGRHLVGVPAAVREATGLRTGDPVHVTLTLARTPREVRVPDDLAAALAADEPAGSFFAGLSNSLQRFHVDAVEGARTAETRQRRIDRAVALFREGRKR